MMTSTPKEEKLIVCRLSRKMLQKLRCNRWKSHWRDCDALDLLEELDAEIHELREAVLHCDAKAILEEGADVANFVAMIHDRLVLERRVSTP